MQNSVNDIAIISLQILDPYIRVVIILELLHVKLDDNDVFVFKQVSFLCVFLRLEEQTFLALFVFCVVKNHILLCCPLPYEKIRREYFLFY